jgi:hypothetical protein
MRQLTHFQLLTPLSKPGLATTFVALGSASSTLGTSSARKANTLRAKTRKLARSQDFRDSVFMRQSPALIRIWQPAGHGRSAARHRHFTTCEVSFSYLAVLLNVGCSQRENGVNRDAGCDVKQLAAGYEELSAPVRRYLAGAPAKRITL